MKHHATKERDTVRHLRDLPEWVLVEFKYRQPWSVYIMPDWVRLNKSDYRNRYALTGGNGNE